MLLLSSADFFSNSAFLKIPSGIPSECQIVLVQIRPGVLLGLIWVQTVCKSYQQTTLGDKKLILEILMLQIFLSDPIDNSAFVFHKNTVMCLKRHVGCIVHISN